jgi:hypothetical protein
MAGIEGVDLHATSFTSFKSALLRDFNKVHQVDIAENVAASFSRRVIVCYSPGTDTAKLDHAAQRVPYRGLGVGPLVALWLPLPAGRCRGYLPGGGQEN